MYAINVFFITLNTTKMFHDTNSIMCRFWKWKTALKSNFSQRITVALFLNWKRYTKVAIYEFLPPIFPNFLNIDQWEVFKDIVKDILYKKTTTTESFSL